MSKAPRDEWITLNGLSFHYRDWGGSGQPVVLLHGLASTCHIWDLVAPILADDCTVVAMDQRGHGRSAKPDHGYDFATEALVSTPFATPEGWALAEKFAIPGRMLIT